MKGKGVKAKERENEKFFENLLRQSIENAKREINLRISLIKESWEIDEDCVCGWKGARKKTMPVARLGEGLYFLACPKCNRVVKDNVKSKDLWKV